MISDFEEKLKDKSEELKHLYEKLSQVEVFYYLPSLCTLAKSFYTYIF